MACDTCRYFTKREEFGFGKGTCGRWGSIVGGSQKECEFYVKDPNKLCFLTTACVEYLGKPDDCYELTALRAFRDNILKKTAEGAALVEEYYKIAPPIVEALNNSGSAKEYYLDIYDRIKAIIALIEEEKNEEAIIAYKEMVLYYQEVVGLN